MCTDGEGCPHDRDRLFAIAREKVRRTQLTALAEVISHPDDIGGYLVSWRMTGAQLQAFLNNGRDHARPTRDRPAATAKNEVAGPSGVALQVVLGALVRHLPPECRESAVVALLGTIAASHRQFGTPLPAWFTAPALKTFTDRLDAVEV